MGRFIFAFVGFIVVYNILSIVPIPVFPTLGGFVAAVIVYAVSK